MQHRNFYMGLKVLVRLSLAEPSVHWNSFSGMLPIARPAKDGGR